MCHAGEVDRLTQFTFVGFQDVVERTLSFKARHSDPMAFPNYLLVLYAWHVRRGDYRNGESYLQPRTVSTEMGGDKLVIDVDASLSCLFHVLSCLRDVPAGSPLW
jgi:hypothetical protein